MLCLPIHRDSQSRPGWAHTAARIRTLQLLTQNQSWLPQGRWGFKIFLCVGHTFRVCTLELLHQNAAKLPPKFEMIQHLRVIDQWLPPVNLSKFRGKERLNWLVIMCRKGCHMTWEGKGTDYHRDPKQTDYNVTVRLNGPLIMWQKR